MWVVQLSTYVQVCWVFPQTYLVYSHLNPLLLCLGDEVSSPSDSTGCCCISHGCQKFSSPVRFPGRDIWPHNLSSLYFKFVEWRPVFLSFAENFASSGHAARRMASGGASSPLQAGVSAWFPVSTGVLKARVGRANWLLCPWSNRPSSALLRWLCFLGGAPKGKAFALLDWTPAHPAASQGTLLGVGGGE